MKMIRITKPADYDEWYNDRVGDIFEVDGDQIIDWRVKRKNFIENIFLVNKLDCEVVI